MSNRQRISAPKKRTGCFACKDAHVQCTEERPSCKRCVRITLKCTYGIKLIWREDSLSRNIAHGRSGVSGRKSRKALMDSAPPSPHFIRVRAHEDNEPVQYVFENLTVDDFAAGNSSRCHEGGAILQTRDAATSTTSSDSADEVDEEVPRTSSCLQYPMTSHVFKGIDSHLLNYFVHELGPKCSLSSTNNPYIHVLIPIAMEFQPLRDALLAVSANSLRLQDDTRYESYALKYKSSALRGLRRTLDAQIMDWRGLATTLMFCFYDVSS